MARSVHPDQLLTFVLSVSMRERTAEDARGLRPSRALPWGMDSALSTSFFSSRKRAAGGCERIPTLSRSPVGHGFGAFNFFRFFVQTRRRRMREGFDPLALSRGAVVHCFPLLSFPCANAPQVDARGFRPSRALPWGCGSQLSTSFASPRISLSRVSPYSSGTRTVSDWGGTIRTADSFFGCAESRFAERKSVWVTASGRVTRISRSAERL